MDMVTFKKNHDWVKNELNRCLNFWLKNGMDATNGGVYTCLDRQGNVFSKDKSVWMQGRCAWTFSYLYNTYGDNADFLSSKKEEWLATAKSCIDFMEKHCINRDKGNRMYFTVTADGKPLRQRRYCFSEGFYAIANAEYYKATGDKAALNRAKEAYELIYNLNNGLIKDPVDLGPKTLPETRTGRALADPMIFLNITAVLRRCDPQNSAYYDKRAKESVDNIFKYHFKPKMKCTLETVGANGEFMDDFTAGRVVNPGHDIECCWFLMEESAYQKNSALQKDTIQMFDFAFDGGWDKEYGGLLYFTDCLGLPPEAYEHDMKLWWPHNELLITSMMIYRDTKDEKYLSIFEKSLEYCQRVFSDSEFGEWYGYLRRDGKPTEPPCKGSTFKGPFHLPRMLIMVERMMAEIE